MILCFVDCASRYSCVLNTNTLHYFILIYITIKQQDAAVRSQFYFTAVLLYMFRALSTPIIRSTLNCITASGTGLIIVVAAFLQRGRVYSQSILFYCRVTLHVSGAFHTHHQEYNKLYHSLRFRSYYSCSCLPPTWSSLLAVNFILLQGYSTCFVFFPHPSSGVH